MTYSDWAPLIINARKHLATFEAAAAIHDWRTAEFACSDAQTDLWQLSEWLRCQPACKQV